MPVRRISIDDLPRNVADRIRFEEAAPKKWRDPERMPPAVQQELSQLWNGIAADVYDEVAGLRRTKAVDRDTITRVLSRVADRILDAEKVLVVAAVHHPLPGERPWRHIAVAGLSGAGAAASEELAVFTSGGTAVTLAILAAIVGEVAETYVAASARTRQYLQAGRSPDPVVVLLDVAEAAGYGASLGRRANLHIAHNAAEFLGERVAIRTTSRFARGLVPIAGIGLAAGLSGQGVRRVVSQPLRPPSADELRRLTADAMVESEDEAYERDRRRMLELDTEMIDDDEVVDPELDDL